MLFSQRHGHSPIQKELQIESIDSELKNRLWNLINAFYWSKFESPGISNSVERSNFSSLILLIWHSFLKWKTNETPSYFPEVVEILEKEFFNFRWYRVYDFIEFIITNKPDYVRNIEKFPLACNKVLEEENAGYRIINGKVTPVTSETERNTIEEIINSSEPFPGVQTHITTALKLLSDRTSPDYRNSIKESISAVESVCQSLTGDDKASLGDALNKLEKNVSLHGAIKAGFKSLYGYTSDHDGIRHAILDKKEITFSDAKYMLVSCSAFANYLIGKVAELQIIIPKRNT